MALAALLFAVLAALLSVAGGRQENGFEQHPVTRIVGTYTYPCPIALFNAAGERTADWHGTACPFAWTVSPERLLFRAKVSEGSAIVAGDPATGELRLLALVTPGSYFYPLEQGRSFAVVLAGAYQVVVPPSPLYLESDRNRVRRLGRLRIRTEAGVGLFHGEQLVLADQGLDFIPLPSPSGRWIAVAQDQRYGTDVVFRISPDGSRVWIVGEATESGERRPTLGGAHFSERSPDQRWTVELGEQIVLRGPNGEERLIDAGFTRLCSGYGPDAPVWAPDSSAFAFQARTVGHCGGVAIADLEGNVRQLLEGNWIQVLGWSTDGISWLASEYFGD